MEVVSSEGYCYLLVGEFNLASGWSRMYIEGPANSPADRPALSFGRATVRRIASYLTHTTSQLYTCATRDRPHSANDVRRTSELSSSWIRPTIKSGSSG